MHPDLERHGAATSRQLRTRRNRLPNLLATGILLKPYPGVYVVAERAAEPLVRVRAAQLSLPGSVLIGEAALAAFEPGFVPRRIDVAVSDNRPSRAGIRQHRIAVPGVIESDGLRLPWPAWNALWLAAYDGGAGIDRFLRRGGSLEELRETLHHFRGTAGVEERRRLLAETKAESWSLGERKLHRMLRAHGFTDWEANVAVTASISGKRMVVDVLFRRQRVIVEFDGWEFHQSREAFETDRFRSTELTADGWVVLRLTWRQVMEQPDWVLTCLGRVMGRRGSGLAS